MSHARQVARYTTSGKEVRPGTLRLIKTLRAHSVGPFQRRALKARNSNTSRASQESIVSVPMSPGSTPELATIVESPSGGDGSPVFTGATSSSSTGPHAEELRRIRSLYEGVLHASNTEMPAPTSPVKFLGTPETPAKGPVEHLTAEGLVRLTPEGPVLAQMSPGPEGFTLATFDGEEPKLTEFPNLLLPDTPDQPAAGPVPTKRPAAADPGPIAK